MSSRTPLNTITFNRESRFSNQTLPFPEDYLNFGIPVATSSTTFTISKCYARNVTDSYNIYIPLPITINVASYGVLNGQCIGNFYVDTVRVTSGSSTITSNSPDIYLSLIFNVGDLITIKSGQSTYTSLVTEIIDNYNIIISGVLPFTSTNANFRRGGSQLGLVPDTKLYFYALGHSVSPGYILTTRNVMNGDKLTDLPTGYYVENSRQLPYYVVVSGNGIIYDTPIALSWNETSSGIITRFANQEETVKGHEKYKAITPSTLGAAIANLNNISEILGIFASDSDALSMVATTKAVTPANIKQLFNTPPAIGSSTPNVGSFTTLTASDITGNAIVDSANIDPNSSKLITMNTLSSALEYANTLGSSSNYVSSSYINSLNVKTLSGSGIVSSLGSTYSNPQKSMPTDINHVLSVAGNVQLLSQPTAIGNISPNTGNFTSLTAKTIYGQVGDSNSYSTGRFSSLTVDSISGNFVASNQDATDMSSATKVLTPSTLPSILSNPSDIGNITPSTGTFTILKADQLGGNIVASDIDALNKVSITKCITPKNIAAILADPGTIGSKNPGIGKFSSITVDNITVANSLTLLKPNGFSFGYMVTCIPKKITPINATTDSITLFSIRYCYARNETNNADIIMSVPSLVDVYEANGLINGMCRSAPLGGTVSVVAGSNIVYGTGNCNFVSDFILGDTVSVGSEIKKIIGINSNTGITSQHLIVGSNFQNTYSGISYYRGGAGLGSLAPNIYYHIYILGSNLTTGLGTPGYVLSTRNVMDGEALVDLPSGYSTANYRQLPYSFYTDSSGLLSTDASPYFAKDSSSGAFLRPAKDQEVIDKKLTYVSVTPASLPKIMANPGPIGSDVPNTGTFTTLAAKSITGECIAKFEDFSTFSKSNRIIVPSSIPYIFANPPALGTTVPAKGTFTTLQANQVTGKCIATDDEVRLKSSTTKLVTPSSLSIILASPGVIGGTTSSDAYFKTVNSQTLNSNVINVPSTGAVNISADANFNGALYGNVVSANKYLGIIGDPVSKNNAYFTNLQADAISGPFLANNADIIARTSTTKLVTPANLQTLFENPPVIGKTTPTTGYFTSIHADSITVAYPISQRAQLPVMYMTSSDVYTTNFYEFTVQYCYARSLDDSLDILINNPKTINIRNQNVINGVCKSAAMPGTVNVATGSNVISGNNTTFNYTFIVGDVISLGGQSYLVSTIDPNSQTLTVDRNVHFTSLSSVYYRGGADTLIPNKIYYFYAVGHSTTPCYMISTRSTDIGETLVDLPTGYNVAYSRQLPYAVQTNSTGTISDQPRPLSSFESSSSITQVASNLEAIQKLNSFKALTPSNIPSFMSVPGPIGNQTPSTGSFTDLTANTIGGSCLATLDDISNGVNNKIVTPASLATLFDSPNTIGSQKPGDAYFNSLTVNNPLQINDTSLATSYNNASLITKGGMSVSQNILVGTTLTTQGKATFNDQVNITSTSVSNSSTTGALTVAGGVGIKGDLNVNGTANFNSLSLSGNFNVPSTTSTTTTTEGALTVAGGVGIKGNIISGGQTYIKNITDSNNTTSGALIVSGGTGIAGNATIGGSTSIGKDLLVSGQTSLTSTTDSNSTNNGSLIISGGIGIAKAVNIGGPLKVNSDSVISSTTDSASPAGSTGSLTTKGGLGITKNAVIGGQLKVESTTQSTSIGTGAAVVSGGLGVGKNLNVGGSISTSGSLSIGGSFSINSGFESNDTQSGALVITGGIGVSGSANVGGNTNISGVTTSKSIIVTSTQKGNTSGTGAITVAGGIGIGDNSTFGKNVSIIGTLSTSGQTTILNNTSSALSITGGAVVGTTLSTGGDLTIGGGATITNSTKITSTNSSTSTDTGALIVSGGVGIKENLTVGGGLNVTGSINMANINVTGTTSATNSLTGALKVAGGISTKENLVVDQNLNVNGKSVFVGDNRINSSTSSTNITSGALTVAGGVGIAGDIYVGNNINVGTNAVIQGATTIQGVTNINNTLNVTGKTSITDTTQSTSTTSGALTIAGGTGIKGALMVGGTTNLKGFTTIEAGTSITNTTNANDSSSGALTVAGGIGVIKDSHLGGNVSVYGTLKGKNTTNSTTSSTGAMIIEGGVGMAKDLHVGGSIYSEGSAYLGGLENNVKLTGGAPGTTPFIKSFSDSDTNVDLKIQPQGFGRTYVVSDLIVTGAFSAASITGVNPSAALPRGYFYISKPPIYLTTSTYNIPDIIARNYNNSANLFVNATNVSINNIDVINGIMTTLMTGTVTVTSGSTTITGTGTSFTTDFVNGDIININNECQVIAEIQSDTLLLVANPYTNAYTDQPYKLNGKCPNANYYIYLVNNATSSAPGFILTSKIYTEGQTLLSVPSNYSNIDYRIVPYKLTTDSSGNFVQTPTSLSGGLGVSNMTKGALIVGTSSGGAQTLKVGSDGQILSLSNGVPTWITGSFDSSTSYKVTGTTEATSSTTGALLVEGGVGIKGSLYVGGDLGLDGANFNTIEGSVVAHNSDLSLTSSSPDNLVITPLGLYNVLTSPPVIGDLVPNDSKFKDIKGNTISGNMIATSSDITSSGPSDKIITPFTLAEFFANPTIDVGSNGRSNAFFDNLDTNSISGNVFSSLSDFGATPSSTKVISPSVLKSFLTQPSDIGTVTPGNAYFNELGFASIASANIASVSDIQTGTSNSTVLTPSSFAAIFKSPIALGSVTPNSGKFTTLNANVYYGSIGSSSAYSNAYVDTLNAKNISGDLIPVDITDLKTNNSNSKVVTPYLLSQYFTSLPSTIGDGSTSAIFDNVSLNSLTGSVFATKAEVIAASSSTKIVSPSTLNNLLTVSPPEIGSSNPAAGTFTTLNANQIYGQLGSTNNKSNVYSAILYFDEFNPNSGGIGTITDVQQGTAGKFVDTSVIKDLFANPLPIGSANAMAGTFSTLKATSASLTNALPVTSGGTGLQTIGSGDLLYGSATDTISSLDIGTENQFLKVNSGGLPEWSDLPTTYTNLKLTDTTASTSTQTGSLIVAGGAGIGGDVNVNGYVLANSLALTVPLSVASGGLGLTSITNGDLLYGSNSNSISKLGIGSNGQILSINSGLPKWINAPSTTSTTNLTISNSSGTTLNVSSNDSAAVNVTGGITANSLALTTALPVTSGGLGFGSIAAGDLIYGSASNILGKLSKGTDGQILTLSSGLPSWTDAPSTTSTTELAITKNTGTTLTISSNSSSAVSVTGGISANNLALTTALPVTSGGLGFGSVVAGDLIYGSGTNTLGKLAKGTNGQILTLSSGVPSWTDAPSTTSTTNLSITNSSGTTLNISSNDSSAVSVTGGISANSLALTTALPVTSGGLGFGSISSGDLIYGSGTDTLGKLTKGTDGQILSLSNGVPTWITGSFDSSPSYKVTGTTEATSTTTGALLVEGGVGIKGSLYVGGDLGLDGANFNTIEGSVVAHNSDLTLTGSSPDNLVITPLGLYNVLTSPPVIGDLVQNDAKFNDIKGNTVSGNMIATSSDITSSGPTNKIITPFTLAEFFADPTIDIGSNGRSSAFFENLDTNSISGNVFSSISDFGATPSSTKVVSPSVLTTFLTKPSDIGTVTPGNAYFKELGFTNIASANIASVSDIQTGTSNSTVLTPSSFAAIFKSPIALGSDNPNSGKFTTLNANVYYGSIGSSSTYSNAYVDTLNAKNISGDLIPVDISDMKTSNSNSKVVTPYLLSQYFTSLPSTIGDGSTSAIFDNVSVNSLSGSVFATKAEVIAASSSTKIVSPSTLNNLLTVSPPVIGSSNPAAGTFTTLNANQIYGQLGSTNNKSNVYSAVLYFDEFNPNSGGLGTISDVQQGTSGKFVDTSVIKDLFANPLPIGSTSSAAGTFSTLKAASVSLTNALPVASGGTGLQTVGTGDLLYGSSTDTISSLDIGTENQFLKVNSGGLPEWSDLPITYTNLKLTDTTASTSTQTGSLVIAGGVGIGGDVNVKGYVLANSLALTSPLSVDSGGLGLSTISNGDLLYGSNSNSVSKLGIGSNGQILSINSGLPKWINAPSTTSTTNLTISNSSGTTLNVSSNDSAAVTVTGGVSANSLTLTTALPVTSGGLGFGSVAVGDLIYGSATNTLGKLSKGTDGQILTLTSGVPSWTNAPSTTSTTNLTISNNSGTTLTVSSSDSTAVSVTGGISANSLALTTALPVTSGGLGFGSVAAGDLIYGSGTNTLGKLSKGTDGQILTLASGVPLWTNAPSTTSTTNLTISNNSGTTLTISSSDSAAVSVTGGVSANSLALTTALPVTSGGTGFGSVATGDLIYGSGTNILGKISKGTDGQILSLASGVPSWTNAPSTTSTTSLSITNTTASNSTTSGSLIVAGGTGIAGNIYGGANGNINGQLTVTGSTVLTVPAATGVSYLNLSYSLGTDLGYSVFDGNVAKFESNSTDTCSMGFPTNTATYASSSWTIEIPVVFYNLDQDMSVIRSTNGSNVLEVNLDSKLLSLRFNDGSNVTTQNASPSTAITWTWADYRLSLLVLQWTGTKVHLTFIDRGMASSTIKTYTASVNCSVNMINGLTLRNPATSGWKFYVDAIRISNTARYVDGSGNQTSITYTGSPLTSDSNTVYINNMDGIPGPNAPWTPGTITTSITSTSPTTGSLIVSGGVGIAGSSYFGSNLTVSGALTLGSALPVTSGGTGISSIASGDIIYGSASNTLGKLTKGTDGQILTLTSGVPSWANAPSNTSTTNLTISNTTGTTLTVSSSASNAISVTGGISANSLALTTALPVTSGGTGLASLTTGDILYASASNTLSKLGKGTDGQILTLTSGIPSWANASGTTSTTSLNITGITDSSSTTTGALTVAGGASVQKNLYIGSSLKIAGTSASSSTTTGAVTIDGGIGVQGTANINALTLPTTTGTTLTVSSTQASSSTTTGAMTIAGGIGVKGTANINTLALPTITGTTLTVSSTQAASSTTTGAMTIAGGIGVSGSVYASALVLPTTTGTTLTISSTTSSSSTTTGAVTIAGGVGIQGTANINTLTLPATTGTTLTVSSTQTSSSTTTGAVTIAGGLGLAGNIYGGNNGNIYGQLTVSGNATITAAAATGTSASNINTISSSLMGFATEGISGEFNSIPSSMTLPTNTSTYTSTAWTLEIPIILSGLSSFNTLTLLRSVNGANIFEVYITTRRIGIKFNDGSTTTTVPASPAVDLIEVTQNYRLSCLYLQWTGTKIQFTFIDRGMTTSSITTFTASLNCSVNMINGMVLANQSGIQYQFYVDTIRISNIARYIDGSGNQTSITYNGGSLSNDSNTVYITRMDTATPTWTAGTIIGTVTATNATTGGLIVNGGIGVTGISYFGNGLSVTDSTVSSSTSTGAVTITGGLGVGGTINANIISLPTTSGTTLTVLSTQASSSTTTGAVKISGGIGIQGTASINVLALPTTTGTTLTVSSTATSSSTTTGAVTIVGGVGIQGTANINTLALPTTSGTTLTVSSTQAASSTTTGAMTIAGGIGISGSVYANALVLPTTGTSLTVSSSTVSSSTTTGAVTIVGGIGIQGTANINALTLPTTTGTTLAVSSTQASSSTTTGAVTIAGGVGVKGNVYSGANGNIAGQLTVGGIVSTPVSISLPNTNSGITYVQPSGLSSLFVNSALALSSSSTNSTYYLPSTTSTYANLSTGWTIEIPMVITQLGSIFTFISSTNGSTLAVDIGGAPRKVHIKLNGAIVASSAGGINIQSTPSGMCLFVLQWTGTQYQIIYADHSSSAGSPTIYTVTYDSTVNYIDALTITNQSASSVIYYIDTIRVSGLARYQTGGVIGSTTYSGQSTYTAVDSSTLYVQTFESTGGANQGWTLGATSVVSTATSSTTGAMVISNGGIGVTGNSYFGNNVNVTGTVNLPTTTGTTLTIASTQASSSTTTGAMTIAGGFGVKGSAYINALTLPTTTGTTLTVSSTQTSSSTTTGAVTISGGVGISGALYTNTLNIASTSSQESTSTDTGALIVNGGVGISKNINIGGNIHFSGTIGRGKRTVITGSYNILESDYIIAVRTQNPITIILPDISSLMYSDKIYIIKAEISDPNISLVAGSSDTIDGTYQFIIDGSYNSISLYTDGISEWFIY